MWHKKQKNMTFPGQTMGPPSGPPNFKENIILPSPYAVSRIDFLDESSRKRKANSLDQQENNKSESIFENCLTSESNPQHKVEARLGLNAQQNTLGMFSNQIPQSVEPNTFGHQFRKYQSHAQNDFSASWQINVGNLPKPAIEKINNSFIQPQPSNHEGFSFLARPLIAEIFTVPNWQTQASNKINQFEVNMIRQNEVHKSSLYLSSSDTYNGNDAHMRPGLKDGMNLGHTNYAVTNNPTLEMYNTSSKSLRSLEVLQQRFVKNDEFVVNLERKTSCQEARAFESFVDVKPSDRNTNVAGTKDLPTVGTGSMSASACTKAKESNISYQNYEVQTESFCGENSGDDPEGKSLSLQDGITIVKKLEGSDIVNMQDSKGDELSPENACISAKTVVGDEHRDDQCRGSLKTDGKSQAGKLGSITAEKLWDGSLQLNSSVTVPAVAFFKRFLQQLWDLQYLGEKAPEFNWSKFLEVKGKVRLEAFEKFIQELPRSRNRGLMVISLCWKAGSSKTGLTGMKEVSKGYKEGERVGFAQLSPGNDLYVCPRSEAIITILAKYGFFKGMAVVGDDQDSLIGCVVWRRIRTSSNSVVTKTEKKNLTSSEQPPEASSNSAIRHDAERNASHPQPAQDLSPLGSVDARSIAVETVGSTGAERRNIQSSKIQCEVGNSFSVVNMMPAPVPINSSISVGLQTAPYTESSSLHGPMEQLLKARVPLIHSSGIEKPVVSSELHRPVLPVQSQVIKPQHGPVPSVDEDDDDDLPEFDFGNTCGVSQNSVSKPALLSNKANVVDTTRSDKKREFEFGNACGVSQNPVSKPALRSNKANVVDTARSDKKHSAEGFQNLHGPVPPTIPIAKPMAVNQQRFENSRFTGFASDINQEMPPISRIREHDFESRISAMPLLDENRNVKSRELLIRSETVKLKPASVAATTRRKNFWDDDDDDDMPEWQPPDMENQSKPPTGAVARPLMPCIPLSLPNSALEKLQPPPPEPRLPSPSSVPGRRPWTSQGLPHGYHCPVTITVKPAQPRPFGGHNQRDPTSFGFSLRPQSPGFDAKPPVHPVWRGWRS